jgi:hypothetical protein
LKVESTDQERIHDGWLLHVDYSRTLTAQEKNFYFYCFHLASRKGIDATRSSRFTARDQFVRDSNRPLQRRKANDRVPQALVRKMTSGGNFKKKSCSHLYLFREFCVLTTHRFESAILFKLIPCICLCGMTLMMHIGMTRLPTCVSGCKGNQSRERICVTSCYFTPKIPSALLVAVVWLQHTWYPRSRRGTFDYGVTTSPNKRGRVRVRKQVHDSQMHMPCSACSKTTF